MASDFLWCCSSTVASDLAWVKLWCRMQGRSPCVKQSGPP